MMQDSRLLTAIDVGTTKVCTIIARRTGARDLKVLAHSVVPCDGLKRGNVEDIVATQRAIRSSIEEIGRKTAIAVRSAYVGITGAHVAFENRRDDLEWIGKRGVITAKELKRVPRKVASSSTGSGRRVLHALPMTYSLDGKNGIRNPLGMHTDQMEVETHVVTGASALIDRLVGTVERAGVSVEALVLEPLASSEAVLTPEEKERGAVLVDIGGGTTDVVVFKNRAVNFTSVIPVAGYQFTNDICQTYNTTYSAAEAVKLQHAHTQPQMTGPGDEVSFPVFGSSTQLRVPLLEICQLTRERAQELIRLIKIKLQDAKIGHLAAYQIVLTGGSANLVGLKELMEQTLLARVRIGLPAGGDSVPDELKAPSHATSVGILLWAVAQPGPSTGQSVGAGEEADEVVEDGLISRSFKQVKGILP